jgi:hypothetical protein
MDPPSTTGMGAAPTRMGRSKELGPSAFRCSCGESALKITGIVDGRILVRCPSCGIKRPIDECETDTRWASLTERLRDDFDAVEPVSPAAAVTSSDA